MLKSIQDSEKNGVIKGDLTETSYTHGTYLKTQIALSKRGLIEFYGESSFLYPEINLPEFVRLTEKGKNFLTIKTTTS